MKNIHYILIVFICTTTTINAQFFQNGSITDNNNVITEGRVLIDNSDKKVIIKIAGKTQTNNFNSISSVTVNSRVYSKIEFENELFLGYELVSGKASLYHLTQEYYLIIKETGEGKGFNLEENKAQIPGILALLFNDCNEIRDAIHNSDAINERILRDIVSDYNNCSYSDYTPTENEMENANSHNTDVVRFYGGFQTGFNNTTVNNFDSNNTTGFGLGLGIAASPGFTGNLQGNLYFDFDVSMIFTGDNDFSNGFTPLNYKVNSFRFSIGMEYLFNKKGVLQPFLGIGYGYTSDYYDGTIGTINFKDHDQNYFFLPKIGLLYKLNNGKHLGLTVSYITEYENDLSFFYDDNNNGIVTLQPLVFDATSISVGLNYYF